MADRRRIAVVSSTRADYGLLFWILNELKRSPITELQLIATGTHLSPAFGHTIDQIRADGFDVASEVDLLIDGDTGWASATSAGIGVIGLGNSFRSLRPDLVLLLGDRYEILASAFAAFMARIPIAHLHGGEVTTGALDDGIRHAISKLSRLHLVSTAEHSRRVIQMGEQADWVHVVGAPGVETIARLAAEDRAALEKRVGHAIGTRLFLLTYHPATVAKEDPIATIEAILSAIEAFPDATVIATGSNADPGGRAVFARLREAESRFANRLRLHESLGQTGYLSALQLADVVIGNSSSGIIEAPSCGTPTVNIGARQDGRPRAPSVIDSASDRGAIKAAIEKALSPAMQEQACRRENPYAVAGLDIASRTVQLLTTVNLEAMRAAKPFVDLEFAASEPAAK
jgi:UDP-N-acetylglucosamine 2-epimerase (non-hydrolysing)